MKFLFVVVVVWFCCLSWLAFSILAYLMNLMHHFFYSTELFALEAMFSFIHQFFLNNWIFGFFFICSSFGRQFAKTVDERVRNLMCNRTLPSLLVAFYYDYVRRIVSIKLMLITCKVIGEWGRKMMLKFIVGVSYSHALTTRPGTTYSIRFPNHFDL